MQHDMCIPENSMGTSPRPRLVYEYTTSTVDSTTSTRTVQYYSSV